MLKKTVTYVLAAVLGAGLLASTQALSQEEKQPAGPSPEQMMEMYAKLAEPGPEHARFKDAVGNWHAESKFWAGPGEPNVTSGTSTMEVVFGGRYLVDHYRCTLFDMPFEGMGITGYDKSKKKYVHVWLDNFSTGFMMSEGTYDEATKTTTLLGEFDDPMTGQKQKTKTLIREVTKDKTVMDMYMIGPDGAEFKNMEITYTRQP
jgi:hypothetical protein